MYAHDQFLRLLHFFKKAIFLNLKATNFYCLFRKYTLRSVIPTVYVYVIPNFPTYLYFSVDGPKCELQSIEMVA